MDEQDFVGFLVEILSNTCYARSFSESGVLTSNEGLVVVCPDGEEFQITVNRSR